MFLVAAGDDGDKAEIAAAFYLAGSARALRASCTSTHPAGMILPCVQRTTHARPGRNDASSGARREWWKAENPKSECRIPKPFDPAHRRQIRMIKWIVFILGD